MGKLNIILGPMYSGKSTELLRINNKYKIKKNILIINHLSDNRYGENNVFTHNNEKHNSISLNKLNDYNLFDKEYKEKIDIILIDEAQFFNDLYDFSKDIVDKTDKIIYIFGLSGDYKREKFGQVLDLIPIADNIKHLKAICTNCEYDREAPFTLRKNKNTNQVVVGGLNEYNAVCRECWLSNNDN
jgi:thymidine kinase